MYLLGVSDQHIVLLDLTSIGKMAVTAVFAIFVLVTAEVFPTILRMAGFGICSMCGRLGPIVAPYISMLVRETGLLKNIGQCTILSFMQVMMIHVVIEMIMR